jgi:hypothetical protein
MDETVPALYLKLSLVSIKCTKIPLKFSKEPTNGLYSQPDESNPYLHTPYFKN